VKQWQGSAAIFTFPSGEGALTAPTSDLPDSRKVIFRHEKAQKGQKSIG
jgi:hypothetical protein